MSSNDMFACIFVPDFPIQAILRAEAKPFSLSKGKMTPHRQAVVVLDGEPPTCRVVAANEEARRAGIEIGMTRVQAETCRAIAVRQRSAALEETAHAALLDCALALSPCVESTATDTVALDLNRLERLYGPADKIASRLERLAIELGLRVHVAVASNPDAAIHAARGFSGVTVIAQGKEGEQLSELAVELLPPPPEILETLNHWGIRTFGELAALPSLAISQRLGQKGVQLQKLASGAGQRVLVPFEPVPHFEESLELEDALDLIEPLVFILNPLLDRLCSRLKARSLATNELQISLHLDRKPGNTKAAKTDSTQWAKDSRALGIHHRTLRLALPTCNSKALLKLAHLDLAANPPAFPVTTVSVVGKPAKPRVSQRGMFVPLTPEPEQLEVTLARIQGIIGREGAEENPFVQMGSPELLDSHRPDAFRMVRFSPHPQNSNDLSSSENSRGRVISALRVFRPPLKAKMKSISDGLPRQIIIFGLPEQKYSSFEVVARAGPWKTSGEWWSDNGWSCEEWDMVLIPEVGQEHDQPESAALFLLYRDSTTGNWYVKGTYD